MECKHWLCMQTQQCDKLPRVVVAVTSPVVVDSNFQLWAKVILSLKLLLLLDFTAAKEKNSTPSDLLLSEISWAEPPLVTFLSAFLFKFPPEWLTHYTLLRTILAFLAQSFKFLNIPFTNSKVYKPLGQIYQSNDLTYRHQFSVLISLPNANSKSLRRN